MLRFLKRKSRCCQTYPFNKTINLVLNYDVNEQWNNRYFLLDQKVRWPADVDNQKQSLVTPAWQLTYALHKYFTVDQNGGHETGAASFLLRLEGQGFGFMLLILTPCSHSYSYSSVLPTLLLPYIVTQQQAFFINSQ